MTARIVIVGASLAGLRAAEAVARTVPGAGITLVGAEAREPYNRPPLSKEAIAQLATGSAPADDVFAGLMLKARLAEGQVDKLLGVAATGLDADRKAVLLGDGRSLPYDFLIAATGLSPRRLALEGGEADRHALRTFDDAQRLAGALKPGRRMIVAGGGFIGCEIAATARKLGLEAAIVEPQAAPMFAALGREAGEAMARFHARHGVELHCGASVRSIVRDGAQGRFRGVELGDGQVIEGDLLVEAVGSVPNVAWLEGAGLDLGNGVLTDDAMRAVGSADIFAVGDIARFPNALYDAVPRRVEHWCVPGQTAKRAADAIAHQLGAGPALEPFRPMPSFWSDQHGVRIQSFGAPALGEEFGILEGDLDGIGVVAGYRRGGRLVGVLSVGAPAPVLLKHRGSLERELAA